MKFTPEEIEAAIKAVVTLASTLSPIVATGLAVATEANDQAAADRINAATAGLQSQINTLFPSVQAELRG